MAVTQIMAVTRIDPIHFQRPTSLPPWLVVGLAVRTAGRRAMGVPPVIESHNVQVYQCVGVILPNRRSQQFPTSLYFGSRIHTHM
jgi:hypothetical protein